MPPRERIGRYEIVMPLSTGGMGDVYLGRFTGLGGFVRHVVLKTLEVGEADEDAEAMFFDEARVLGVLHHQHIAPVFELFREDGRLVLVIDYVHGRTAHEAWQRTLDIGAALPIDFSLTVVAAAASGLQYAHTRRGSDGGQLRIVHRDVSLSNVMVGYDGAVKLIDFGIAKVANRSANTQVGFVKGKLGYMAPEQLRGQPVDARTDIFALGIVLYELTTMRRAFREESDRATVEKIKNVAFTPPSTIVPGYPAELERIVTRTLKLDPRERYPDGEQLRQELEALGHRLELVLGDAAIVEVMGQLFEERDEPWQKRPRSRAETELDVSLEIVSDDHTRPSISPNKRHGTLRTATQAVDALIQSLDTPPRGTPLSRELSTVSEGGRKGSTIAATAARQVATDEAAVTPVHFGNETDAVTTIQAGPHVIRKGPPPPPQPSRPAPLNPSAMPPGRATSPDPPGSTAPTRRAT